MRTTGTSEPGGGPGAADDSGPSPGTETRRQVRGSGILLTGRLLSMAANLAVQVLIVRHLSRGAYGAFAYAMSFVVLGETVVTFGLDRTVTRFIALYDERRQPDKMLGTIVMVSATIVTLGTLTALVVWGTGGSLVGTFVRDREAITLLGVLILLAPIQALDSLAIGVFAVFSRAGAIFVRRYVLAPGLRLAVVLVLIAMGGDVHFLAVGYVAAAGLGLVIYLPVILSALREHGLIGRGALARMQVPAREIIGFTLPLLTTDLVYTVLNVSDAVMLGYFANTEAVGALRAVQPIAKLNLFVMSSFALLYTPLAARLHERRDREGLDHLYWQTAMWLAVLTFPVFLAGFALARPVTLTLFGEPYAESAAYLALLAFGYYTQAAFGFNGLTLKCVGAIRIIVVLNLSAAVLNIGFNLVLIPRYGALGAAAGTALALLVHNVLKQLGLRRATGVSMLRRDTALVYLVAFLGAVGLGAAELVFGLGLVIGLAAGAVVSLAVLAVARPLLDVAETFPELMRIAPLRVLLGERPLRPGGPRAPR